jgi:hypothetical protein
MTPASIMNKISDAWLSHAVNLCNLSMQHTFNDEIENISDRFCGEHSIAVFFSLLMHSHVFGSRK